MNAISWPDGTSGHRSNGVAITAGFLASDIPNFVNRNGISGRFADGVRTLSGDASLEACPAARAFVANGSTATDPGANAGDITRGITSVADNAATAISSTIDLTGYPCTSVPPTLAGPANKTFGSTEIAPLPGFAVTNSQSNSLFNGLFKSKIQSKSQSKIQTVTVTDSTGTPAARVAGTVFAAGTILTVTGDLAAINAKLATLPYADVTPAACDATTDTAQAKGRTTMAAPPRAAR